MDRKIRVGIVGYGNLGKACEYSIAQNDDIELCAVFTRRDPKDLNIFTKTAKKEPIENLKQYQGKIDVMILCGGSATDLPAQGPEIAKLFCTVDSFDTHAKIPEYFEAVDKSLRQAGHVGAISIGWDPGMFSLNRMIASAILPDGQDYTFWGKGVSQGHSDAIRRVAGVKYACQYTVPIEEAVERVRSGENPELSTGEKHLRECYVVLKEGADANQVEQDIKTMPNYFADYTTHVHFISEEEYFANHTGMPHGGFVIRTGRTGADKKTKQKIEYSLALESNPEFTASILVCYARAVARLKEQGEVGAKTVFDIPPCYLSAKSAEELRRTLL